MTDQDAGLREYFTLDHRNCDSHWSEFETALDAGNEENALAAWQRFDASLRRHLAREEEIMFPAFEEATGMTGGPTMVMRSEHEQMRGLLTQMGTAAQGGDLREVLDQGDTLHMLIQQHNQKEEGMLYPMAERALAPEWASLRKRLEEVEV